MKKTILVGLLFLLSSALSFADGDWINYFQVSSNIAQPVTIKTNLGTYSFRGSFVLNGHISRMEAFDYYGNRIINTQPNKYERGTKVNKNWYVFSAVYESDSGNSGYANDRQDSYGGSSSPGYSRGPAVGPGPIYSPERPSGWGLGKSKLDISAGVGVLYGVCGGQVSYRLPRLFGVSGGLGVSPGKDYKVNWNVGAQIWITNWWNIGTSYIKLEDGYGWGFYTGAELHLSGPIGLKGDIGFSPKGWRILDLGVIIRLKGND